MPARPISTVIKHQQLLVAVAKTSVSEAARLMEKHKVGAVMVVDAHGQLSGIFTERDALFRVLAAGRDPATTLLSAVMTKKPQTIAPDRPVGHALHMMYENGFRHVPVVERGRPGGHDLRARRARTRAAGIRIRSAAPTADRRDIGLAPARPRREAAARGFVSRV